MNVNHDPERLIDATLWTRPDVRGILAARDIASLFRLLQQRGVSQRRIAALTGQSQSEVSEILSGRQVMAYDVLVRIAEGLGIPRGLLGLAYDRDNAATVTAAQAAADDNDSEEARRTLARAAEVTIGAAVLDPQRWSQPLAPSLAPTPAHISAADLVRLESLTRGLKALDATHGGGSCRDAVVAHAHWAQQLLLADCTDAIAGQLHAALADLHHLAGWSSFDVGLYRSALEHFVRALEQARFAGQPALVAKVLYCIGRLYLHRGRLTEALRFLQLGQLAAQESGCGLAVAMLCANEAWTYAVIGDGGQALRALGRAEDAFTRAETADAPIWVRFFGEADLHAMIAMTYAGLPTPTGLQRSRAIEEFGTCLARRGPEMARSRAFELAALAAIHLLDGDLDHGVSIGHQAVDLAEQVRSLRVLDRLRPLLVQAREHPANGDARGLVERITTVRGR